MAKNLKLSYILLLAFSVIEIAFFSFAKIFFGGVGLQFVAMLGIFATLLYFVLTEHQVKHRIMDMFIVLCVFIVLEIPAYFAFEYCVLSDKAYLVFENYQTVLSILNLFFFAYILFRLFTDLKNIKIGFIEVLLGNQQVQKRDRTPRDLKNGSLQDKPNNHNAPVELEGQAHIDEQENNER